MRPGQCRKPSGTMATSLCSLGSADAPGRRQSKLVRIRADAGCWSGQRAVGAGIRAKEAHRLLPWITRTGGRAVGAHWTLVRRDTIHTQGVIGFPAAGGFCPLVSPLLISVISLCRILPLRVSILRGYVCAYGFGSCPRGVSRAGRIPGSGRDRPFRACPCAALNAEQGVAHGAPRRVALSELSAVNSAK